jgi:hypothetical protein
MSHRRNGLVFMSIAALTFPIVALVNECIRSDGDSLLDLSVKTRKQFPQWFFKNDF